MFLREHFLSQALLTKLYRKSYVAYTQFWGSQRREIIGK